ncbi:MAG: glycosyltransferase family 4 protein [Candidatus Neomarinimicrobiota bacterium]
MKNILFLTHNFPPEVNAPANRTYEHAIIWQKLGANVTIITNHPNHPHGRLYDGYKNRWLSTEIIDGIKVIRVKTYLTANKDNIKRSINFLVYFFLAIKASTLVKNVDVIIATSPQFFCGLAGTIIKKIKNKPFVLEVRDLWPDSIVAVKTIKENLFIKFLRIFEKKMYYSADRIVVLTNSFKKHILGFGFPSEKILTIPNGVILSHFNNVRELKIDLEFDFTDKGKFFVSYIGTFGLAHGIENIILAAEILQNNSNIHFLLVGDGSRRKNLLSLVKKLGLTNVTILPLQSRKMILNLFDFSDVGVVTLINSPLFNTVIPSKIFEYMAARKPLIISVPWGETTKIIERHFCGINVTPENPGAISESILKLYNNNSLRTEMGANGNKTVKRYYNRERLATQMYQIIISDL